MFDKFFAKTSKALILFILTFIAGAIILCCIVPTAYFTFQSNSFKSAVGLPTSTSVFPTKEPTQTPKPTIDPRIVIYITDMEMSLGSISDILADLGYRINNATLDNANDIDWRNDMYARFDKLIEEAEKMGNKSCPEGFEEIQSNLKNISPEFVEAKKDFVLFIENQDKQAVDDLGEHMKEAGNHLKRAMNLLEVKKP